ncbi:hypothetical protein EV360DRAFT_71336 [Lentinula raphanica]|nr:hypothetical protein EV360DRAFT_71336 [Lentinula raphanica]
MVPLRFSKFSSAQQLLATTLLLSTFLCATAVVAAPVLPPPQLQILPIPVPAGGGLGGNDRSTAPHVPLPVPGALNKVPAIAETNARTVHGANVPPVPEEKARMLAKLEEAAREEREKEGEQLAPGAQQPGTQRSQASESTGTSGSASFQSSKPVYASPGSSSIGFKWFDWFEWVFPQAVDVGRYLAVQICANAEDMRRRAGDVNVFPLAAGSLRLEVYHMADWSLASSECVRENGENQSDDSVNEDERTEIRKNTHLLTSFLGEVLPLASTKWLSSQSIVTLKIESSVQVPKAFLHGSRLRSFTIIDLDSMFLPNLVFFVQGGIENHGMTARDEKA